MDILKRIDHAQQFCKFYADGAYSVEKEKWNYHVTPEFIKDIRQYIESLQLKLMHLQKQQAEPIGFITPPGPITQYTIPTQRQWQGLTDEDRRKFAAAQYGWEDLLIAAEAKLKERNHG